MTRVLHTAWISNVDSVMFVDRNKRDGEFWARWRNRERLFFRLVTSVGLRKFWVPMRNRTSALRCSTTEPQRLHCERGLFYFLQSSVSAKCWLMLRYLTVRLHVYGIKEPSICRTDVSGLWRQLVFGQSNDITRCWDFPRIKVISTKTSVIRERQKYIFVWCLTSPKCSTCL